MHAKEFQNQLLARIKEHSDVDFARSFEEAGQTKYAYGMTVVAKSATLEFQITGQFYGEVDIEGDEPFQVEPCGSRAEMWLLARVNELESKLIESAYCWTMPPGASQNEGVTVRFRNGDRAFLRILR